MQSTITLHDLSLRCYIGELDEERAEPQEIIINVECGVDIIPSAVSDDLADTLDYRETYDAMIRLAETSRFKLLERLAIAIADICFAHPRVAWTRVRVEKPRKLMFCRAVSVSLERSR